MFALDRVSKTFGDARSPVRALSNVSLRVDEAEIVALVGPSGSGKTTLLNLLARIHLPDEGTVTIDGRPSHTLKPGKELSSLVGIMAQRFDLVDSLPVIHNVLAGRLGQWSLARSLVSLVIPQESHLAVAALQRVGIGDKIYERTSHLSGGQQQRVALARLLVQRPRAILADEPVSSLDPARAEDLIAMLTQIAKEEGLTLVASLHSVSLAIKYFSRMIALREGTVFFDLPTSQVDQSLLDQVYDLGDEEGVEVSAHRALR